jgi:nitrogen regulatory protein PII-like uncharacterized protein
MSDLREITSLGESLKFLDGKITKLEEELEQVKKKRQEIAEFRLPELMMAAGMESFTLEDGTGMDLDTFYNAKIPDDKSEVAFRWLEDNGEDAIIKSQVQLAFGKGESEKERELVDILKGAGYMFTRKRGVHPQTLKAFVRDAIESGKSLPLDAFGVFIGKRVKVRKAK